MATEQHIVKPPDLRMDHRKIVNIVRKLASVPVDEQRGREALQSLIELSAEVDDMIRSGPLTTEMKRGISLISLRYPGQNLYWNAKNVATIPTLQFHDLVPYLGCLTKSNEHERERILRPAFLKVKIVLWFFMCSCVDAQQAPLNSLPQLPETIFSVTNDFLFVQSVLYKHEVVDFTEKFNFSVLKEMDTILKSFKQRSESFKN